MAFHSSMDSLIWKALATVTQDLTPLYQRTNARKTMQQPVIPSQKLWKLIIEVATLNIEQLPRGLPTTRPTGNPRPLGVPRRPTSLNSPNTPATHCPQSLRSFRPQSPKRQNVSPLSNATMLSSIPLPQRPMSRGLQPNLEVCNVPEKNPTDSQDLEMVQTDPPEPQKPVPNHPKSRPLKSVYRFSITTKWSRFLFYTLKTYLYKKWQYKKN